MMRMTSHETDKSFSPSLATSLLLSFPALALLLFSQQHQPENVYSIAKYACKVLSKLAPHLGSPRRLPTMIR
ncbi:hypothetical protein V8C43DRAFT_277884 [Trichoderma afarasin]